MSSKPENAIARILGVVSLFMRVPLQIGGGLSFRDLASQTCFMRVRPDRSRASRWPRCDIRRPEKTESSRSLGDWLLNRCFLATSERAMLPKFNRLMPVKKVDLQNTIWLASGDL